MSLLWWTTTLGMRGCSFSRRKGRRLVLFGIYLVLRLRNERHGNAIRAIRSDNGSEFRNSRFETLCHDLGLEHLFSSPYTPPQNCVVERKNRTLFEMARMMLDEHSTPRRF
jgi:transposase InsO family protein